MALAASTVYGVLTVKAATTLTTAGANSVINGVIIDGAAFTVAETTNAIVCYSLTKTNKAGGAFANTNGKLVKTNGTTAWAASDLD